MTRQTKCVSDPRELDLFGLWHDTTELPLGEVPFGDVPSSRLPYIKPTLFYLRLHYSRLFEGYVFDRIDFLKNNMFNTSYLLKLWHEGNPSPASIILSIEEVSGCELSLSDLSEFLCG